MAFIPSANSIAQAMQKARTTKPNYSQNPNSRQGTVSSSYNAQANPEVSICPVVFDGESTAVNLIAAVPAFANDRVLIDKRGNTWVITGNLTTPRSTIGKIKLINTTRTGSNAAALDPELFLNLPAGSWMVEMDLIWTAGNAGKLATTWIVPADTVGGVRQTLGPGQTSVSGDNRGNGSTSRWGSHQWATAISYAGSGDGVYMDHREWAWVQTFTGGTVTLGWARPFADTPGTVMIQGSSIKATRMS